MTKEEIDNLDYDQAANLLEKLEMLRDKLKESIKEDELREKAQKSNMEIVK